MIGRVAKWANTHLADDIERVLCTCAKAPVRIALALIAIGILGGGTAYAIIEKGDLIDGWYWAVVVMTTVGFGDFSPETIPGRWVFVFVVSSGIFATVLITSAFAGAVAARRITGAAHATTPEIHDDLEVVMARMRENAEDLERLLPLVKDPRVVEALRVVHNERSG